MLLFSLSETAHGRSLLLTQLYRLPNFRKQLMVDPIIILGEEKDVHLTDNYSFHMIGSEALLHFHQMRNATKPQSKNTKCGVLLSPFDERTSVFFLWAVTLFPTEMHNAIHSRKYLNNHV